MHVMFDSDAQRIILLLFSWTLHRQYLISLSPVAYFCIDKRESIIDKLITCLGKYLSNMVIDLSFLAS
jgi:hypothetical protein